MSLTHMYVLASPPLCETGGLNLCPCDRPRSARVNRDCEVFCRRPDWLGGNPWEDWRRDRGLPVAGWTEWEGEVLGSTWI